MSHFLFSDDKIKLRPLFIFQTLINLLHNLAANPRYAYPMREEIQTIVRQEGWTRNSVDKMHKLDSFIKETMRISGTPSRA